MKGIRLTIAQMRSVAGSPDENLAAMERIVRGHPDSDIVCFPEMCLSGYSSKDPLRFGLDPGDAHILRIHELSKELDVAIVFGYIERQDDDLFLRQEIADSTDDIKFYRKSHLGLAESRIFSQGSDLPVFDVKGCKVAIQLCTESHIPDITSTYRGQGAELVLMPFANGISGEKRRSVWNSYLPARACDNGIYVAGCSAVGDNGEGSVFGGGLIVLDPKGMVMKQYYGTDEHAITVDIGGRLPRDGPETMSNISYYDRRRPELYR